MNVVQHLFGLYIEILPKVSFEEKDSKTFKLKKKKMKASNLSVEQVV